MVSIGFLATSLAPLQHDPAGLERELRAHRDVARVPGAGIVVHLYPHQHPELCGCAEGKNNQISSFSNFARNFGGSMGTALLTTFLVRTQQTHQSSLAANFIPGSIALRELSGPDQERLDGCGTVRRPGQGRSHRVRLPAVAAAVVHAELSECFLGAQCGGGTAGSLAIHHAPSAQAQEAARRCRWDTRAHSPSTRCRAPGDGSADR